MYLASVTSPDILFAMSKLSRFTSNTRDEYPAILEGYNDANWISDVDELYATSGYVLHSWW
jgi:hypothetical protein